MGIQRDRRFRPPVPPAPVTPTYPGLTARVGLGLAVKA